MAGVVRHPRVGIGCLIFRGAKVLVGCRKGSHGAGTFALPGGHLDFGETWEECAAREVKEETGLDVQNLRFAYVNNNVMLKETPPSHYITIFMRCELVNEDAEPQNLEPDKCLGWEWHTWPHIPEPQFSPLKSLLNSEFNPFQ